MGKGGLYGGGGMLEVSISESGVNRTSEIFNLKLDSAYDGGGHTCSYGGGVSSESS